MRSWRLLTSLVASLAIVASTLVATTPAWAIGNYALHFSGQSTPGSSYVGTGRAFFLNKNFTFSADVRWDGTLGYTGVVSRPSVDTSGNSGSGVVLGVSDGKPYMAAVTGLGARFAFSNTTLTPNVWYTIAGSYDGSTMNVYIDGALDTTNPYSPSANVLSPSITSRQLVIGREFAMTEDPDLAQRGFHGDIDNVAFMSGADPATASVITKYTFSEGEGSTTADSGQYGFTGTLSTTNSPTWVQGSDPVTATYQSTEPGVPSITQSLRPYSPFTLKAANTFSRAGYTQPQWNTGPSTAALNPGTSVTMPLGGITYYPVWAPTTQSVIYQAGLGQGSDVTRAMATGTTFTLPTFASIGFTRAGYHQSGWTISSVSYSPGARVTMGTTNITVTANWVADNQTVTYVLNGGTGTAPTQTAVPTGSRITVAGATNFSRSGYTFAGWTDGGVINYQPGNAYTVSANPIQFTAQWIPVPQTITYNAGVGGTGTPPASASASTDSTFVVATRGNLVRPGYTFTGWQDQNDDPYAEGATYNVGANAVTLSAVWTADSHTVTYVNSNDSSGVPPTQADVVTDDSFIVADGSALSLDGYAFSGWTDGSVDADGNPIVYQPDDDYIMGPNNVQLEAMWTALPHTISFRRAGGDTGTLPASFVAVTDSTFTVPGAASLVRPGYTFAGWRDGLVVHAVGSTFTVESSDVSLVAEWTADTHTVTYSAGAGGGTVPTQTPVATDSTFTVANGSTLNRSGYAFGGWLSSAGGNYQAGGTFVMGTSNVTLTALWIPSEWTVSYFLTNAATGTAPDGTVATTSSTFTTAGSTGFARAGYTLSGWFDGSTTTNPNSSYTQGVGDTNFYSRWTAQTHTVTYLAGSATGSVPTQSDVDTDATFALASDSTLTRSGYTFAGWAANGSTYPVGFTYTAGPNDMTFTASWSANLHHYVFVSGDGAVGMLPAAFDVATDASADFSQPNLTRPGYDFAGWTDGTTTYTLSDLVTPDGDTPDLVFLAPVWTAQTHTVTYDINGGSGATPTQSDSATNTVFSVADEGNISRDGYSFGGWTDGVSVYQAGNDYLVGATNVTLTAVWNPIFLSVAYLIGDGASGVPPQQDPIPFNSSLSIASGEGISLDGQYFWGWSDGSQLYVPGSTMTNVRSDVTLTATWGDHPLPELPNTGRNAIADVLAALFALLGATLGVVLVRRTRRRGTLDA
jgi:uncharacterized repeat protein (TIGR02543 family)/LPXTG-motif cell wall-anchored protein